MDNHWVETCVICDAELHTFEYAEHLRLCLCIEAKRSGRTDFEIQAELRAATLLLDATPEQPVPHSQRGGWPVFGSPAIPPGHTECLSCFGNRQLYPGCEACDGKGWV